MPKAEVTIESLMKVKITLQQFKADIASIPQSILRHEDAVQSECEQKIRNLQNQIDELRSIIRKQESDLGGLNSNLIDNQNRIKGCQNENVGYESEIAYVQHRISILKNQKASLDSQLAFAQTYEEQNVIQGRQADIMGQIQNQESSLSAIYRKIDANRNKIENLEGQKKALQQKIEALKAELKKNINEEYRKQNKLDRMNVAFSGLKNDMANLTTEVRRFADNAVLDTDTGIAGVNQCILYIDEYMSTNL